MNGKERSEALRTGGQRSRADDVFEKEQFFAPVTLVEVLAADAPVHGVDKLNLSVLCGDYQGYVVNFAAAVGVALAEEGQIAGLQRGAFLSRAWQRYVPSVVVEVVTELPQDSKQESLAVKSIHRIAAPLIGNAHIIRGVGDDHFPGWGESRPAEVVPGRPLLRFRKRVYRLLVDCWRSWEVGVLAGKKVR